MKVLVSKVSTTEDIKKCLEIRKQVFVDGQNVSIDDEIDGKDAQSVHYLLVIDSNPVGTARVRFAEKYAKIERVAILNSQQGQGFGGIIMQKILTDLKLIPKVCMAKLSSQTYAIPFYEKFGFTICSPEYMDAGISHKDMQLHLN